jgi:hypothetical protein
VAATKQAPTYHIKTYNYKELRVCLYKYGLLHPAVLLFVVTYTDVILSYRLNPRKHYGKWGKEPSHKDASESKSLTHDYLGYAHVLKMTMTITHTQWSTTSWLTSNTFEPNNSFGKLVYDQVLPVANFKEDEFVDFVVDLTPGLKDAKRYVGQVGIVITPTSKGTFSFSFISRPPWHSLIG